MNKPIIAAVALLIGIAPPAALAASAARSTVNADQAMATPTAIATVAIHHSRSTVHHANGERFDVPNSLLRNRDTLINGLPPEPSQFE